VLGDEMPRKVVVGYHQDRFGENFPGEMHYQSKAATFGHKWGKAIGTTLKGD
jgi:hypothetical protein